MSFETFTIYPTSKHNRPLPPPRIPLHGTDFGGAPIDIRNHRFYHHPPSHLYPTTAGFIEKMKSSLAEALELYPPVAGLVRDYGKENAHIAMDNESRLGTPFSVEKRDTPFLADSEDLSPRLDLLLPLLSSTLAVKVTEFSCGTIAVAASINHLVTDLRGHLDFLEVWATITRGDPVNYSRLPDDWTHTPGRFFSGLIDNSAAPAPPPGFQILPVAPTGPPAYLLKPSQAFIWKFSKSSINKLKRNFSPPVNSSKMWISSGDALTALIWGAISRARHSADIPLPGAAQNPDMESRMMAADGRERAPNGDMVNRKYFGNFNPLFNVVVPRSDLLSVLTDAASRVALEIRNALTAQLSPKAIAEKISFLEANGHLELGRVSWSADVIITNWSRNDLQDPKLDLGWGKPFAATNGGGTVFPPAYVLMTEQKDTGEISAVVTVEKAGADALKADPVLNTYAALYKIL